MTMVRVLLPLPTMPYEPPSKKHSRKVSALRQLARRQGSR
jgi:hypothetical protein